MKETWSTQDFCDMVQTDGLSYTILNIIGKNDEFEDVELGELVLAAKSLLDQIEKRLEPFEMRY